MSCEKYKSRIADAAANVGAGFSGPALPDSDLSAHLESCSACREEFDAQCALFATVDRGVAAMVAGEPSGDFAAQVRRRIAEQSTAPRPWFAGWLPVTAAAMALLVLVTLWATRRAPVPEIVKEKTPPTNISNPPREPKPTETSPNAPEPASSAQQKIRPPRGGTMARIRQPERLVAIGGRPPRGGQMAAAHEPEVLVPRGETQAIARLLNANWSGKADGASLTAQVPPISESLKPMSIEELKIPALETIPAESAAPPKGNPEK